MLLLLASQNLIWNLCFSISFWFSRRILALKKNVLIFSFLSFCWSFLYFLVIIFFLLSLILFNLGFLIICYFLIHLWGKNSWIWLLNCRYLILLINRDIALIFSIREISFERWALVAIAEKWLTIYRCRCSAWKIRESILLRFGLLRPLFRATALNCAIFSWWWNQICLQKIFRKSVNKCDIMPLNHLWPKQFFEGLNGNLLIFKFILDYFNQFVDFLVFSSQ